MGLTVFDAGVIIAVLDGSDVHHDAAQEAVSVALGDGDELVLPSSALAEVLVRPARRGPDSVRTVEEFLDAVPIRSFPLNHAVAKEAAFLRAQHRRLKLPDALVVASAIALEATRLVTTDRRWPPRSDLGLRCALTVLKA